MEYTDGTILSKREIDALLYAVVGALSDGQEDVFNKGCEKISHHITSSLSSGLGRKVVFADFSLIVSPTGLFGGGNSNARDTLVYKIASNLRAVEDHIIGVKGASDAFIFEFQANSKVLLNNQKYVLDDRMPHFIP